MDHGTISMYGRGKCRCDECRAVAREYRRVYLEAKRREGIAEGDPRHGTASGYNIFKCKCEACVTWNSHRPHVRRRKCDIGESLAIDDPRHGTGGGYNNYGCRCPLCSEWAREDRHLRRYGETRAATKARLDLQGGMCAACGASDPGSKSGWHTDHSHQTGTVRGVLCHGCNVALGFLGEDPVRIAALLAYATTLLRPE